LPLVVQASEGGGKWLEGERYSQAALDVQASPTNVIS
jgi:hypothetical protein